MPIHVLFGSPRLGLHTRCALFSQRAKHPLYMNSNRRYRQHADGNIRRLPYPSPSHYPLTRNNTYGPCKQLCIGLSRSSRLNAFVFHAANFGDVEALTTHLECFTTMSNGGLSYLPLRLALENGDAARDCHAPVCFISLALHSNIALGSTMRRTKTVSLRLDRRNFSRTTLRRTTGRNCIGSYFRISDSNLLSIIRRFCPVRARSIDDARRKGCRGKLTARGIDDVRRNLQGDIAMIDWGRQTESTAWWETSLFDSFFVISCGTDC